MRRNQGLLLFSSHYIAQLCLSRTSRSHKCARLAPVVGCISCIFNTFFPYTSALGRGELQVDIVRPWLTRKHEKPNSPIIVFANVFVARRRNYLQTLRWPPNIKWSLMTRTDACSATKFLDDYLYKYVNNIWSASTCLLIFSFANIWSAVLSMRLRFTPLLLARTIDTSSTCLRGY